MPQLTFKQTKLACYIGYITQAIVNNLAPLLFLTFSRQFGIPLSTIALISSINFGLQLLVDLISAKLADRIGYRPCMIGAHISAAVGLVGLAVFPFCFANRFTGILLAVLFYAVGSGLNEVLVSPIIEACPTENKEAEMSLLHSFYCWGVVAVILVSTLFFNAFGIGSWRVLVCLWALVPLANTFLFMFVPINHISEQDGESMPIGALLKKRIFWLLVLLMVCSGASELALAQWCSAFTESALHVSKTMGDLLGPCVFAILMGCARMFYGKKGEKIDLSLFMLISGVLCVVCYLLASLSHNPYLALIGCGLCGLSVGIMWPGTFSIATVNCRGGGTAMFALLALAGDLGGTTGPALISAVSRLAGGNLKMGILAGCVFPILLIAGLCLLRSGKAAKA